MLIKYKFYSNHVSRQTHVYYIFLISLHLVCPFQRILRDYKLRPSIEARDNIIRNRLGINAKTVISAIYSFNCFETKRVSTAASIK